MKTRVLLSFSTGHAGGGRLRGQHHLELQRILWLLKPGRAEQLRGTEAQQKTLKSKEESYLSEDSTVLSWLWFVCTTRARCRDWYLLSPASCSSSLSVPMDAFTGWIWLWLWSRKNLLILNVCLFKWSVECVSLCCVWAVCLRALVQR